MFSHNQGRPLYLQLKQHLLGKISTGEWKEGDRIPTELKLKNDLGLSRATIRQALTEMEREGFIERRRGSGTTVCHQRIRPELMKLTSFTEDMTSRGHVPGSQIIDLSFAVPPAKVQEAMSIGDDEKVWWVKRLRTADATPLGIQDLYIPPDLSFSPHDLYEMQSYYCLLADRCTLKPAHASETLTASGATKAEGALLQVPEGTPLLIVWRKTFSEEERILEVVRLVYLAGRYEYRVELYV